jgi:bidirectional [NiFe] hydrogenase diaphorase subunit
MSEHINFSINGAAIRAPEGTNVLDAALEYGICIPHLCHMQDLLPMGVCRLCIVEHVENGRSKVTTACTLEAKEGMTILAHTDKIVKARRVIAEMLVAEAPNSRAVQDMAVRCGVKTVRFPFRNKNCILCGRCVRVCDEVWQSNSLGFVGRGKARHVALPFHERPDFCKRCWSCSEICPMTITPCDGPMIKGKEYLCSKCESQLSMALHTQDTCVQCRLGEGFGCVRADPAT